MNTFGQKELTLSFNFDGWYMFNSKNNVVIADTQFLVIEALKSLLSSDSRFSITAIVGTQYDLNNTLKTESCQLLITDFNLIDFEGLGDLQELRKKFPDLAILILTNSLSKSDITELSKIGIRTVVYKTSDSDEIWSSIDAAIKGKKFYSSEVLDLILELGENKSLLEEPSNLTSSEIEIVRLVASGLTTKEIASRKNISFHTVNTHRKNIFRKLGVSNTSELIIQAIKSGWIDNIEYYI